MKSVVRKLKPVDSDSLRAAAWYEDQQPGLGDAFANDLDATINLLSHDPLIYSVRFADVRCIRLRRFTSYGIYYLMVSAEIWILAIHHGARHPRWLRARRRKLGESI
jgi:toxin ParE2